MEDTARTSTNKTTFKAQLGTNVCVEATTLEVAIVAGTGATGAVAAAATMVCVLTNPGVQQVATSYIAANSSATACTCALGAGTGGATTGAAAAVAATSTSGGAAAAASAGSTTAASASTIAIPKTLLTSKMAVASGGKALACKGAGTAVVKGGAVKVAGAAASKGAGVAVAKGAGAAAVKGVAGAAAKGATAFAFTTTGMVLGIAVGVGIVYVFRCCTSSTTPGDNPEDHEPQISEKSPLLAQA